MATLEQIVAYLRQNMAKYPVAALRAQLLKQNIPQATVDNAIRIATGAAQAVPAKPAVPGKAPAQPAKPLAAQQQPAAPAQPAPAQPQAAQPPQGQPAAEQPIPIPKGYMPSKAPPVIPPPGRAYVLVVDDDQLIRDMLVNKLEGAGYRVTCAEDAAQSVIQAEGMRLALLVSDIEMPGFGTGVDALKKLRGSNYVKRNLPVIFVTGMPPNEARKIVPLTDPYVRLMHKPVDWNLLRLYIRDLTGMDRPL